MKDKAWNIAHNRPYAPTGKRANALSRRRQAWLAGATARGQRRQTLFIRYTKELYSSVDLHLSVFRQNPLFRLISSSAVEHDEVSHTARGKRPGGRAAELRGARAFKIAAFALADLVAQPGPAARFVYSGPDAFDRLVDMLKGQP